MINVVVIDKREKFREDVKSRLAIDEDREIGKVVLLSDTKELSQYINNTDGVLISDISCEDPDLSFPNGTKILGYTTPQGNKSIFNGTEIRCIGRVRSATDLLNLIEFNLDFSEASIIKNKSDINKEKEQKTYVDKIDSEALSETSYTEEITPEIHNDKPVYINCPHCNGKILEGQKFCNHCGCLIEEIKDHIDKVCPNCGKTISDDSKFCPYCGTSICNIDTIKPEPDSNESKIEKEVEKDLEPDKHECVVIAVYAAKGGVGKTTVSSELASYFATTCTNRRRTRVCIIDYNIDFGDVASTLGFSKDGANMMDWVSDIEDNDKKVYSKDEIEEYLQKKDYGHDNVVYGLIAPSVHTDSMLLKENTLTIMIDNIIQNGDFDYVICDTGNNTRDSTIIAITKADYIFLICTQDVTTVNCNQSFLETLEKFQLGNEDKIKLIINDIVPAKETGISTDEIKKHVKFPCIAEIRRESVVTKANNYGEPLVLDSPNSSFTKEIEKIAKIVAGNELQIAPKTKKRKLFGKKR